jgi:hypothetical protein
VKVATATGGSAVENIAQGKVDQPKNRASKRHCFIIMSVNIRETFYSMKRVTQNLTVLVGLTAAMTLSLSGVASAHSAGAAVSVEKSNSTIQEGSWYGPLSTKEECERARVLFDYSDPCSYRVGNPKGVGWYFYGGFN